MEIAYLTTAYLAPIEYFCKLYEYERIIIEQNCNYIKQTYRNRCTILGANGPMALSIPIEKPETLKCATKEIRISDHGNWRHLHWNAIQSAYNSSPYFEYYQDDFIPFYEKKYDYLFDFNEQLREMICELIDLKADVVYSDSYLDNAQNKENDFRELIHPKKNTNKYDNRFAPVDYYQVFSSKFGFVPNLSIIDLLFNMGPESILVIKKSNQIVQSL